MHGSFDERVGIRIQFDWSSGRTSCGKPSTALPAVTPVTGAYSLASSQPFQYKGQYGYYTEGGSGLIYCQNRFYDPNIGRWISRDPIGLDGGVNVYGYVDGNPVNKVDRSGTQGQDSFTSMFNRYFGKPDLQAPLAEGTRMALSPLRGTGFNQSWKRSMDTLFGWLDGTLPARIEYQYSSAETQEVIHSKIGSTIWSELRQHGLLAKPGHMYIQRSIGTPRAFLNSISEPANGTQFQLGAVEWEAWRKGNRIRVKVANDITPQSLLLHLGFPEWTANELTPMSTVRQIFWWDYIVK